MAIKKTSRPRSQAGSFTVPGLTIKDGHKVAEILQERLHALIDLALTLKHVHWNVVGPNFIAVHQMLDPQVDAVRAMSDVLAERIATLGAFPPEKALALEHCILAHHGPEALPGRRFASAEALALHRLNALDASVKGALEHGLG